MSVYLISYDIGKHRDRNKLLERLQSHGTCCPVFDSSWLIATDQSTTQIRNDLVKSIDRHDRLLVTRLQGEAAWRNLGYELSQWLKNQLTPRIA
jgi:CRISPR/Cas system-associated endoribonuclease Cas2